MRKPDFMPWYVLRYLALILFTACLQHLAFCQVDRVEIEVRTEEDPTFINWELFNSDEELLASQDTGYSVANFEYRHEFEFPAGQCYILKLTYAAGNTFRDQGYFNISVNDSLYVEIKNLWFSRVEPFHCGLGQACHTAEQITSLPFEKTIAAGKNYYFSTIPAIAELYTIEACGVNAEIDTEIIVYEDCGPALLSSPPEGAIFYSDDGICSPGSSVDRVNLVPSKFYIFRVRVKEPNISQSIIFTIKEGEAIKGCMDLQACNYDMFADIEDGSCIYEDCAPDLVVGQDELINSIMLDTILNVDPCFVEEGCLQGFGYRAIVRFTTHIKNIGNTDYIVGNEEANPASFSSNNCHSHPHALGYAEYALYKGSGEPIPLGYKNGFCVFDLVCDDIKSFKFSCDFMGISAGCTDFYDRSVDCQWIDITDLPDGDYTLVLRINWDRYPDLRGMHEASYENNWAQACINIDRSTGELQLSVLQDCAEYTDCLGFKFGQAEVDCAGVCGGNAHYGDMNGNLRLDGDDIMMYLGDVVDGDENLTTCTDIYQDGKKSLYDAALLQQCYQSSQTSNDIKHFHCRFPGGQLNEFENISFQITNLTDGSFDVEYLFPYNGILGMSLTFSDILITHFERLDGNQGSVDFMEPGPQSLYFLAQEEGGHLSSSPEYKPVFRVFFENQDDMICLDLETIEVINSNYQMIMVNGDDICIGSVPTSDIGNNKISIYPTITEGPVAVENLAGGDLTFEIYDMNGSQVDGGKLQIGPKVMLDFRPLSKGVYIIVIKTEIGKATQKIIKI